MHQVLPRRGLPRRPRRLAMTIRGRLAKGSAGRFVGCRTLAITGRNLLTLLALAILAGCTITSSSPSNPEPPTTLRDASRERQIPISLYFPDGSRHCTPARPCPVAFVSPGYGLRHTDYSFIANALAASGYLVVAIQHDLPTDPPLSKTGNLFTTRMPAWQRGAANIRFVRSALSSTYSGYDWHRLTLIGHSNGGDISALAVHDSPTLATTLVTLDNRRYPLPRAGSINVLSIRGSDFEADSGILPPTRETGGHTCIISIPGSRHNDMNDRGPIALQSHISAIILQFLNDGRCVA